MVDVSEKPGAVQQAMKRVEDDIDDYGGDDDSHGVGLCVIDTQYKSCWDGHECLVEYGQHVEVSASCERPIKTDVY